MWLLQKITKLCVRVDAAVAAEKTAVAAEDATDATKEDVVKTMLDAKFRDHGYCEPMDDERLQSQIDSNHIQRMYEWSIGSKHRMSYFVVDKFCKLYKEYNNWD